MKVYPYSRLTCTLYCLLHIAFTQRADIVISKINRPASTDASSKVRVEAIPPMKSVQTSKESPSRYIFISTENQTGEIDLLTSVSPAFTFPEPNSPAVRTLESFPPLYERHEVLISPPPEQH